MTHKQLKPENVLITSNNKIKISDFGINEIMNLNINSAHDSPELCLSKVYNEKTDIWSLGCIMYELCTLEVNLKCKQRNHIMEITLMKL